MPILRRVTEMPIEKAALPPLDPSVLETIKPSQRRVAAMAMWGGANPKHVNVEDLLAGLKLCDNPGDSVETRYRNRIRSPLTAIRAECVVNCKCGVPSAVRKCTAMECVNWAFRLGRNPFFGKMNDDAAEPTVKED